MGRDSGLRQGLVRQRIPLEVSDYDSLRDHYAQPVILSTVLASCLWQHINQAPGRLMTRAVTALDASAGENRLEPVHHPQRLRRAITGNMPQATRECLSHR